MAAPNFTLGTPSFFPSLLANIRQITSNTFPVDPVILQSILLCLVAGDKHLILRTSDEDVTLVVKLAALVSVVMLTYDR